MVYIYIYMNISHKNNEIMPFAATYVESKKIIQGTYLQNINRLRDIQNKLMVTKGERGGDKLGVWD